MTSDFITKIHFSNSKSIYISEKVCQNCGRISECTMEKKDISNDNESQKKLEENG